MGEHQWYRYECSIRNEKEGEDCISENIFEAWTPALRKHLFENRNESRCYNRSQFWIGIIEHIERDRKLCIRWVKENYVIGSRFWYVRQDSISEITMRIYESNSSATHDVTVEHIFEKSRFSHTSFPDNIGMSSSINGLDAECLGRTSKIRESNRSIGFCHWR